MIENRKKEYIPES